MFDVKLVQKLFDYLELEHMGLSETVKKELIKEFPELECIDTNEDRRITWWEETNV